MKVKKDIKPEYAATVAVNPCTAYRLLNDFVKLQPGNVPLLLLLLFLLLLLWVSRGGTALASHSLLGRQATRLFRTEPTAQWVRRSSRWLRSRA